jgi:hypothetical protein
MEAKLSQPPTEQITIALDVIDDQNMSRCWRVRKGNKTIQGKQRIEKSNLSLIAPYH